MGSAVVHDELHHATGLRVADADTAAQRQAARGGGQRALAQDRAAGGLADGVALNLLRNKRSVVLDLKCDTGREAFLRIAKRCDVLVTNLRPGPLARLRLAYEDLKSVREDIVYCRAHGFLSDSARANAPAYDDIIQSASGIGDLFRRLGMAPTV